MIVAGRTQMMDAYPVPEALARMRQLGFSGAEICVEDINFGIRPELLESSVLGEIRSALRDLGFQGWSYSYHADYITDDEILKRTIRTIELTRDLGTDVFVFSGRRSDKHADSDIAWRSLVARTRRLVEAAEANDVKLALEAEPGFICGTSAELRRLIDEIGSPALGCNMDIGHAFLCDPDPIAAIHDLGDRILHAHVENMRRGVHDHRLPSDGDMDLARFLGALTATGFTGVAALDLYGYDYEAVARESIRAVEHLLGPPHGAPDS
ncbi:MAG TPA: sugar phosphate isomerase/epimerase [Spirochaetia bacterium]|nr:sugar phosphate isomerase/epimerase [Spirochaetia bacterium]